MRRSCGFVMRGGRGKRVAYTFILVFTFLICAGLLVSCGQWRTDVQVTIVNQSGTVIDSFTAKMTAETEWGEELLPTPVEDLESASVWLVKAVYDFRVVLSDTSVANADDVDLTNKEFFTLTVGEGDGQ